MENYQEFTNLFQLNKTLRFELKPIGKTCELLEEGKIFASGSFLEKDKVRADNVSYVKKEIDKKHKIFIEETLSSFSISNDLLKQYFDCYNELKAFKKDCKSDEEEVKKTALRNKCTSIQRAMREAISQAFLKSPQKKLLAIKNLIENVFKADENVQHFSEFTSYFSGFETNRENFYSDEEKSTSIAYRLVHDNLPIFIKNIYIFEKLKEQFDAKTLSEIFENYKLYVAGSSLDEVFSLEYFNNTLTQKGIDNYNAVIGKIVKEDKQEIQGLNEHINLYNQKHKDRRLPFFISLKKQILSDREALSWLPDMFKNDSEVIKALKGFYIEDGFENNVLTPLATLLSSLDKYNLNGIFIRNNEALSSLSQNVYRNFSIDEAIDANAELQTFNNYELIANALRAKIKKETKQGRKSFEKYEEYIDKKVKAIDSLSIQEINELVENYVSEFNSNSGNMPRKVEDYFSLMRKGDFGSNDLIENIKTKLSAAEKLLGTKYQETAKDIFKKDENSKLIKELLDATKQFQHFIKPLLGTGEEADRDLVFYGDFLPLYEKFEELTLLYNKVRNRLTQKPYSKDKIRLCFNKPKLMTGWVDSKTEKSDNGTQYGGYLFRKKNEIGEYDYFLGISSKAQLFRKNEAVIGDYERLDYYQPKANTIYGSAYEGENSYKEDKKRLNKVIIAYIEQIKQTNIKKSIIESISKYPNISDDDKVTPSSLLEKIKKVSIDSYNGILSFKSFQSVNKEVIDNLLKTISPLKNKAEFLDLINKDYQIFTEVQAVIDEICKQKTFIYFPISNVELEKEMGDKDKPLCLFQISNKDLSFAKTFSANLRKKRGAENLHTMLFKALMEGNQDNLDLGSGAIFYRAKSLDGNKPTHPANEAIKCRNVANKDKVSLFTYDIYKNRRYMENKFLFHLSIVQNYKAANDSAQLNSSATEYIRKADDLHIIGIDRGERNLLYYSVIDMKGNIVEQDSLNIIRNNDLETDYHDLLDKREKERKANRQNWEAVEGIKDLKKGYLSQAVHQIAQLMLKYNAIIALEDLGQMFVTRGQKIEKAVYQQFEKSLVDKLSYLVDKKRPYNELGGILKAYQLASSITKNNSDKQNGFLFYVPAWNTSKIDPVTGFTDLLRPKAMTIKEAQDFFGAFDNISYNDKGYFEFETNYDKFKIRMKSAQTRWTICTFGNRIKRKKDKNYWNYEEVELTEEFKKLFKDSNIDYENCNLKEEIQNKDNRKFFDDLIKLLQLTLQMRNSDDKGNDYIISPVANAEGQFFDSRNGDKKLPLDADANGAYNIARKGLWNIRQIKQTKNDKKLNLSISSTEWLDFVREKPYLK
ncbi:hypothetical protein HMPREF9296_0755 [Prevotella disiens FB035-09AN]|uniref:Type V CRISPR-associated protein Cpf1 n=2 Tax=Prevotella disiens TaxID=28130 RepID=E1KQG5_9BACT